MKKNLVVQANTLIEAHYRQTYTIQEQRTVLWVISQVHREDRFLTQKYEHKSIRISAKKYAELMGISVDNVYRDAEKIANSLGSKRFTIKTPTGWINLGWISSMEYIHGEGMIEVLIAPGILPYIIGLKEGNHTSFQLENILCLQSGHAIKLYQLLAQRVGLQGREIAIDELRSLLGIENIKTYSAYGKIKEKILKISKREINKKTDLMISYSEVKKGKRVQAIKFKVARKQNQEIKPEKTVSD